MSQRTTSFLRYEPVCLISNSIADASSQSIAQRHLAPVVLVSNSDDLGEDNLDHASVGGNLSCSTSDPAAFSDKAYGLLPLLQSLSSLPLSGW